MGVPREQREGLPTLTDKQRLFADHFILHGNATDAAIKAGYSEHTAGVQGSRLLKNVKVAAYVREGSKLQAQKIEEKHWLTTEYVLNNLKQVVVQCMKAEPVMEFDYDSKSMVPTGEWTFDSKGANRALELLGKQIGLFRDPDKGPKKNSILNLQIILGTHGTQAKIIEGETIEPAGAQATPGQIVTQE